MSPRLFVAYFKDEHAALAAVSDLRMAGYHIHDVYTPYAVHGMDEAMGLRPSRLTWVCFLAGTAGLTLSLLFQWWTSSSSWALNVGGKPFNSFPAFIPVAFELTVLFAALGTVAALFLRCRLVPGAQVDPVLPGVTDDRFAVALATSGTRFEEAEASQVCARAGALSSGLVEVRA